MTELLLLLVALGVIVVLVPRNRLGDRGFVLAQAGAAAPPLALPDEHPSTRFLDEAVLAAAGVFPPDRALQDLEPSTLDQPLVVEDVRQGYEG